MPCTKLATNPQMAWASWSRKELNASWTACLTGSEMLKACAGGGGGQFRAVVLDQVGPVGHAPVAALPDQLHLVDLVEGLPGGRGSARRVGDALPSGDVHVDRRRGGGD